LIGNRSDAEVHNANFAVAVDHDVAGLSRGEERPWHAPPPDRAQLPRNLDALVGRHRPMRFSSAERSSPSTNSIDR
jgi:hypothetical protein